MEFLSGGVYKATVHRVVQPPPDQQSFSRLGAFYFALPDDDVRLVPVKGSLVLDAHGIQRRFEDNEAPTVETWRKGRTSAYGQSELNKGNDERVEEEYINGVLVKHYN